MMSCNSQKQIAYFQGLDDSKMQEINNAFHKSQEPIIRTGDMLLITVSALDPVSVAPFNLPLITFYEPGRDQISADQSLQYYLVDRKGEIDFPQLGKLKVGNLTKIEIIEMIEDKLHKYLVDPIVTLRLLNYKITVLGEVARPGQYTITNEKVSLLNALGMAGDMTIYGQRENVLLVREVNDELEFHRLDLTDKNLFKSPYFYLQQNDVLYVEPNSMRSLASQNLSVYFSIISSISTVLLVFATFIKN